MDGAIHKKAGPDLLKECRTLNGCKTGEAKITGGYNLKVRYIIHTPGPIYKGGTHGEDKLLISSYRNSFLLAKSYGIKSVAFSAISTGVYGYPVEEATHIAVRIAKEFVNDFDEIVFYCFLDEILYIYQTELKAQKL